MEDLSRKQIKGSGIAVRGNEIDTDRIIPARFLKCVVFDGLAKSVFYDERYDAAGAQKAHPFNDSRFEGATLLVVNKNFGCGSSREHAPQAIMRWGIRAIMGESFAEIFAGNCQMLGVPAVCLGAVEIKDLMQAIEEDPQLEIEVDMEAKAVRHGDREVVFELEEGVRTSLVEGKWDSTGLLMANEGAVRERARSIPYLSDFQNA